MINRAELKNFGPIEQLDWQNLGKINLIIGENGCGKSFVLKALYSAVRSLEEYKRGDNPESIEDILRVKLHWTFQAEKVGDLVHKKDKNPLSFDFILDEKSFHYSFGKDTTKIIHVKNETSPREDNSIYLPAKEVLSLFRIILDSREHNKKFGFDDTYVDLANALLKSSYVKDRLEFRIKSRLKKILGREYELSDPAVLKKIMDAFLQSELSKLDKELARENSSESIKIFQQCQQQLDQMLGGKIEYDYEDDRWHFRKGNQKFSVGVMAEGIKKISILDTLLENGYLNEKSVVFIDEPESNLHPRAIAQLLDIIASLAQHGIQFFLASHSYFVVKKLFLIAQEQQMSIPVLSYQNGYWIQSDLKDDLPDNPIIDESIRLYEQQLDMD